MSWKRKGGVDKYESKYASAKVEACEGGYCLTFLTKHDGMWHVGITGDREYCKAIGAATVDNWGNTMVQRYELVAARRKDAEDFANLPENEKRFVKLLRMIANLPKEQQSIAIQLLPDDVKPYAIEWCDRMNKAKESYGVDDV